MVSPHRFGAPSTAVERRDWDAEGVDGDSAPDGDFLDPTAKQAYTWNAHFHTQS
jgi:hypothetical protein